MDVTKRQIIAACLAFEKHDYEFKYSILPYIDCDICKKFKTKPIENKLSPSTPLKTFLNDLAVYFSIKITFISCYGMYSTGVGKELFIRKTPHNFMFHSNPGRICKLPAGVGKRDGCYFKCSDILKYSTRNKDCTEDSVLRQIDADNIERKYDVGLMIWTKNGREPRLVRHTTKETKIHLHADSLTGTLFCIKDLKLYLRGFYLKNKTFI